MQRHRHRTKVLRGQGIGTKAVQERNRMVKKIVILLIVITVSALFAVWSRVRNVQMGYEIASLEKENRVLKQRKRELLLEIASLQSPGELERQARQKAKLVVPPISKVVHVP